MVLTALVPLVAGCGHGTPRVPSGAIALVGDHTIPRADLDVELARARRAYAARGQAFPKRGTLAYEHLKDAAVRLLVDRAELEVEAKRARIAIDPTQVDARLREFKRTTFHGDESRFSEQLRRTGVTEAQVREAIRAELLTAALRGVHSSPPRVTYAPGFEPGDRR